MNYFMLWFVRPFAEFAAELAIILVLVLAWIVCGYIQHLLARKKP